MGPAILTGATLGLLVVLFMMFAGMKRQMRRLAHVDAKLDQLLSHAGIKYDPLSAMLREAADALKRGDKFEAIRLYRAGTGVSLAEAKQMIDAAQF